MKHNDTPRTAKGAFCTACGDPLHRLQPARLPQCNRGRDTNRVGSGKGCGTRKETHGARVAARSIGATIQEASPGKASRVDTEKAGAAARRSLAEVEW